MSEVAIVEFFNDLTDWLMVGLEHLDMAVFDDVFGQIRAHRNKSHQWESLLPETFNTLPVHT